MAGKRILFVCFDPELLVSREFPLIAQGYDVRTVLGLDGLIATRLIEQFDFILIGDEGSLGSRQSSIRWLKEGKPSTPVIALCHDNENIGGADYQVATDDEEAWPQTVAACVGSYRKPN